MSLLVADAVSKQFGALQALNEVDFQVKTGEIVGIIGPNGAGKSTLFNLMTGQYRPDRGRIVFDGRRITGLPTHRICRMGLVKTAQITRPFARMTVLENVLVGSLYGRGLPMKAARHKALNILDMVGLSDAVHASPLSLTVAMRRRLELARALAVEPKAILLDENVAGLTPAEIDAALELLREINRQGVALVVVEHIMQVVMGICHRVMVLDYGRKIAEGPPETVVRDPGVIEAYLGEAYA